MVGFPYSEEDQVEQLKKWWKQNGSSIIFGVVLGLAIVGGFNYWKYYKRTQAETASKIFERMMIDNSEGQTKRAQTEGATLMEEYKGTPYAAQAALYMARISYDNKDLASAEQQLRWAMNNADDPATVHTARLRLGRLLFDAGKYSDVATLIAVKDYGGFESEYKELEGDVALARKDAATAATAYQRALEVLSSDSGYRPMLKVKLDQARAQEQS